MKARAFFLLSLFCLLAFPALAESVKDLGQTTGIVAKCFDGDTFQLMDRRVMRLAGIDAPEVPHGEAKAQYYSRQARKILEGLAKGAKVSLTLSGVKPRDNHGRYLVEARLPDGTSLNEALVDQGAAFYYPHVDLGPDLQERLSALQADAIKDRRGFWEYILSLPIATQPYIGNRETLRFFPADCVWAQQIKPRNRVNFGTLMDAFLAGYAPARVCQFWPPERDHP